MREAADSTRTVTLAGELDLEQAETIKYLGLAAFATGVRRIEVDLEAVTFMDSTALGALIELRNRAQNAAIDLVLVRVRPNVARLLDITGLTAVFGLADDDRSGDVTGS